MTDIKTYMPLLEVYADFAATVDDILDRTGGDESMMKPWEREMLAAVSIADWGAAERIMSRDAKKGTDIYDDSPKNVLSTLEYATMDGDIELVQDLVNTDPPQVTHDEIEAAISIAQRTGNHDLYDILSDAKKRIG